MVIFWLLTHIIHFFYWYHHFVPFPSGMYIYIYIFFFFLGGVSTCSCWARSCYRLGQEISNLCWAMAQLDLRQGSWVGFFRIHGLTRRRDLRIETWWVRSHFLRSGRKGNKFGQSNDVAVPTLTFIQVDEWMMDKIWVWFIDFFAQLGSLFDFVRWPECCFIFLFFGFLRFFFFGWGFYKTVSDSQLDGNWWLKSCQTPVMEWTAN